MHLQLYRLKITPCKVLLLVLLLAKRRELLDVRNSSTPGPTVTDCFRKRPIASQTMRAVPRIYSLFTYHSLALPSIRRQVLDQLLSPFTDDWPHQHLLHTDFQAANSEVQGAVLTSVSNRLRCGSPTRSKSSEHPPTYFASLYHLSPAFLIQLTLLLVLDTVATHPNHSKEPPPTVTASTSPPPAASRAR